MSAATGLLFSFPRKSFVALGAGITPGVAVVKGAGSPRNWDVQQGFGMSGAVVLYKGAGLAKFEVDVFLWLPEQFVEWEIFAETSLRKPLPGLGAGAAMDIRHPLVNGPPWNITSVVVEDVTQFEQNNTGLWACTIKLLEYRKPLPALARPIASIPAVDGATVLPANATERAIIATTAAIAAAKAAGD